MSFDLPPFLHTGRCHHKKDAELLVASGSDPGHTADQSAHCQSLRVPGPGRQLCCHRGRARGGHVVGTRGGIAVIPI